jgi:hypothetical protein
MRIEEGKYYRTRDGRKVGPLRATDNGHWPMECDGTWWRADGESCEGSMARMYPENDIVAEWTDEGPVRTVTRQEIIPGTYDGVCVRPLPGRKVDVSLEGCVYNADQLERAAAVLTALAGALRDGE